jgi:predicted DNA-binding protein (MmcQ/YjbR family)
MAKSPIQRLRQICLALPEATEKETWDRATWRVCDKIFAVEGHSDGRLSLVCKAPAGSQAILVGADPARFFIPPYVGHKGWIGMWLDRKPDWVEAEKLARRSYCLVAPKRLAGLID